MTAMVGTLISTSEKEEALMRLASRSLMNTNPLALPPIDPEPICVQRKVPSQNLRSKTGNSATKDFRTLIDTSPPHQGECSPFPARHWSGTHLVRRWYTTSHPAAFVARLGYAADRDRVGRVPHVQ